MEKIIKSLKRLTLLAVSALLSISSLACGPYMEFDNSHYSIIEERTFNTTPGKNFNLEASFGDVIISTSNEPQVLIKVLGNERTKKRITFKYENSDEGVSVVAKRKDGWNLFNFGSGAKLKFEVVLPVNYNVKAATSGGDILLSGLDGKIKLHSSGGDIKIKNTNGDTFVSTSGGDVSSINSTGNLEFKTSGGNVHIDKFNGNVDASTSGGDIFLDGSNGAVKAHTSGGEVSLNYSGQNYGIDLASSGGDVRVQLPSDFAADAKLYASGGDIKCSFPTTNVQNISSSKYEAELNNGGMPLVLRSSGGDIRVRSK